MCFLLWQELEREEASLDSKTKHMKLSVDGKGVRQLQDLLDERDTEIARLQNAVNLAKREAFSPRNNRKKVKNDLNLDGPAEWDILEDARGDSVAIGDLEDATKHTQITAVDEAGEAHEFSSALAGWKGAKAKMEQHAQEKLDMKIAWLKKEMAIRMMFRVLYEHQCRQCNFYLGKWERWVQAQKFRKGSNLEHAFKFWRLFSQRISRERKLINRSVGRWSHREVSRAYIKWVGDLRAWNEKLNFVGPRCVAHWRAYQLVKAYNNSLYSIIVTKMNVLISIIYFLRLFTPFYTPS